MGLLTVVGTSQPEVLLLDVGSLKKKQRLKSVNDLHCLQYHPKVIVLSPDLQTPATTLAARADGFITKTAPPDELLPILRKIRLSDTLVSTGELTDVDARQHD